jgi:hypothetical protein
MNRVENNAVRGITHYYLLPGFCVVTLLAIQRVQCDQEGVLDFRYLSIALNLAAASPPEVKLSEELLTSCLES